MIDFSTNLDALNALLNINNVSSQISLSTQRLSSGLRINSAADDPAGFVTANALQVQADGLNQAVSNIQTSTNLIKTANSALSQIGTLVSTIRTAAQDAANNQSNTTQVAADQQTIQNALTSINNITSTTAFGSKNLLNGSSGASAALTDPVHAAGLSFGGAFGGGVTQSGAVSITVNTVATQATITGTVTYAGASSLISSGTGGSATGGTLVLNGQTITAAGSDTVQTVLDRINTASSTTGVTAALTGGKIVLTQSNYGANFNINLSSSAAVIGVAGSSTATGVNANVTVNAQTLIGGNTSTASVSFDGGRYAGQSGLYVTDTNGNAIQLTGAGNVAGTYNIGSIVSNATSFQVGANAGQTASVQFPTTYASNLGQTSVAGQSLASVDVTTQTGANNAITIATEASGQIAKYAAQLGSFQKNVLDASSNVLQITAQNLQATVSSIQDVNIATESANLAKLQVIQQAGVSVLHSALSTPSLYLKLLS